MEMGPVCRSRLMSVTGEPTQMRRLAEDWLGWLNGLGAFRRNLGDRSVYYSKGLIVFHDHNVMARRVHSRESISRGV
jgi:hypothetical protein